MLNERASGKLSDLMEKIANPPKEEIKFPNKPTTQNSFGGTRNVNIVCQTLVVGSLQELMDAIKDNQD